jgi:hypothetical protein
MIAGLLELLPAPVEKADIYAYLVSLKFNHELLPD